VKFLVTGGGGFIGSHLVEHLVLAGNNVIVLDNFSTGKIENLTSLRNQIEIVQDDVRNADIVKKLVSNSDHVIHLAAALGVFNIVNDPLESLSVNLQGTEVILQAANQHNKPVLIASSSEIYGKNDKVPLNEDDDRVVGHPLKSRWSYSEAKAVDESLAYFYHLESKLPVRIVRFFNTVGPRQVGSYGMVVPRFISSALKNQPLEVYGDGMQIRCFCHVKDAVRALELVIDSEEALGNVFNIGNNEQVSILDLAKRVIEVTGSKSEIVKIPYSKAYPEGFEDMQKRVPDISKIMNFLGWTPQIGLDQIIQDVVAFQSR